MKKLILLVATLIASSSLYAQVEYGYSFTPADNNSQFGGQIFLKESHNTSGTLADIDFNSSYLNTPDGNFSLTALSLEFPFVSETTETQNGLMSWTTGTITTMDITGATDNYIFIDPIPFSGWNWEITSNSVSETFFEDAIFAADPMDAGSWNFSGTISLGSVPDNSSSALLLGGTVAALSVLAWRQKRAIRA